MSPKQIHVVNSKGGCGRSTVCISTAAGLSQRGHRVLVVDLDANGQDGGSLRWATQAQASGRSPAFFVVPALPRRLDGIDVIIWDHAPGAPRLPDGHVIVPTTLDPGTFFSAMKTMRLMKTRKPSPILVANRVRIDRADNRRLLDQMPGTTLVVRDRSIFPTAYGRGASIYDDGLLHAPAARAEFDLVIDKVENCLGLSRKAAA